MDTKLLLERIQGIPVDARGEFPVTMLYAHYSSALNQTYFNTMPKLTRTRKLNLHLDIIATQPTLVKKKLLGLLKLSEQQWKLNDPDQYAFVFEKQGKVYVWDGHHRLILSKLKGLPTMQVQYLKLK